MIIVIGLVIAFVLVLLFARQDMRHCRWRKTGEPTPDGKTPFRCMACGAPGFTSDGNPPKDCKINSRL